MYLYTEFCGNRWSRQLLFPVPTGEGFAITDRQRSGLQFETIERTIERRFERIIRLLLSVFVLQHGVEMLRRLVILQNQTSDFDVRQVLRDNGDAADTGIPANIISPSSNPTEHCSEPSQLDCSPILMDLSITPSLTIPPSISFPFSWNFYAGQNDLFPSSITDTPVWPNQENTATAEFDLGFDNTALLPWIDGTASSAPLLEDSATGRITEVPFDDIDMDPAAGLSLLPGIQNDMY